jgi:hypothetical protein
MDRSVFGANGHDGVTRVAPDAVQQLQYGSRDDEGVTGHSSAVVTASWRGGIARLGTILASASLQ